MQNDNSQGKTVAPTPEYAKHPERNDAQVPNAPRTIADHPDDSSVQPERSAQTFPVP
jgi:hypothetical protein